MTLQPKKFDRNINIFVKNKERDSNLFDYESKEWYKKSKSGWYIVPDVLCEHLLVKHKIFSFNELFYQYSNGYYEEIKELEVKRTIKSHLDINVRPQMINEVTSLIKQQDFYKMIEFNKEINIINCKNYMIEVKSDKINLYNHSPNFFSTIRINANYKEDYNCKTWLKFLSQLTSDENVKIIQEMFGYTLIPEIKAQTSFIFYGKGGIGKTVLLTILQKLIGKANYTNIPFQKLGDRFNKVMLFNKLANICGDLPNNGIDETDTFKMMVGGDEISAEKKRKDGFCFVNKARCIFSCNKIPISYNDTTTGYFRRLKLIPCVSTLKDSEKHWYRSKEDHPNLSLEDKLMQEIDGIFMWALAGLQRLMGNNYIVSKSKSSESLLSEYKRNCSSLLDFIDENCEKNSDYSINAKTLYNFYKQTLIDEGARPLKYKNFQEELKILGFPKTRDINERIFKGLKLVAKNEIEYYK